MDEGFNTGLRSVYSAFNSATPAWIIKYLISLKEEKVIKVKASTALNH